jgi:hypothetical protein
MNQNKTILTNDDLSRMAPATFAQVPAVGLSDRYRFISTINLVDQLRDRGWMPVAARQAHGRRSLPMFATHMITFEMPSMTEVPVGGIVPQLRMIGNHMGSKAWNLIAGIFKKICANGLCISIGDNTEARIIHVGDAEVSVSYALGNSVAKMDSAYRQITRWQDIELSFDQRMQFALEAAAIRFGGELPNGVNANEFLTIRRDEDRNSDLWTVFNRVQENVIQGGVRPRGRLLRGIRSATTDTNINLQLWALADSFAKRIRSDQSLS